MYLICAWGGKYYGPLLTRSKFKAGKPNQTMEVKSELILSLDLTVFSILILGTRRSSFSRFSDYYCPLRNIIKHLMVLVCLNRFRSVLLGFVNLDRTLTDQEAEIGSGFSGSAGAVKLFELKSDRMFNNNGSIRGLYEQMRKSFALTSHFFI